MGLSAARLGAAGVVLTDLTEHVPILGRNAVINRPALRAAREAAAAAGDGAARAAAAAAAAAAEEEEEEAGSGSD